MTEYAGYVSIIFTIWTRKKKDWDRLLRLPLKLPKTTSPDMQNLLGGLWNEIETNKFKNNLIEESEITYRKTKLDGFEDDFEYTNDGETIRRANKKRLTLHKKTSITKQSVEFENFKKSNLFGSQQVTKKYMV